MLSLILLSLFFFEAHALRALVIKDPSTGELRVVRQKAKAKGGAAEFGPNVVANAKFDDTLERTGWGQLKISTNPAYSNVDQMRAAGKAEGDLTFERIYQQFNNIAPIYFPAGKKPSAAFLSWLDEQEKWMRDMINAKSAHEEQWLGVAAIMSQFDGLVEGYNERAAQVNKSMTLAPFAFKLLNGAGDWLQLIEAVDGPKVDPMKMSPAELERYTQRHGHCSVLIRVTPEMDNVFVGHTAWFMYASTNRIYKRYEFPLKRLNGVDTVPGAQLSFSSYPGFLESLDDFYMAQPSNITMVQTTNSMFNTKLWETVKNNPHALLAWHRTRLAMLLASTGNEWGALMGFESTGTYTNQYMVIDWNHHHRGIGGYRLEPGFFTLVENMPTLNVYRDLTEVLSLGYWGSYNVPYFPEVQALSHYPQVVREKGVSFSHEMAPRARIMRRDAFKVTDLASYKAFMRYNDFKNDPLEEKNPMWAIASRGDLQNSSAMPFGGYDTKVTQLAWASSAAMRAEIINGPTRSHGLPAYSWNQFPNTPHLGLPETYNFDFIPVHFDQ